MRNALIVEVQPEDLGALTFIAGMLVGMGRPEGEIIRKIMDSVQMVEVDDNFGAEDTVYISEAPDETEVLPEGVDPENPEGWRSDEEVDAEFTELDLDDIPYGFDDPDSPESLGIDRGNREPEHPPADSVPEGVDPRPRGVFGYPVEFGAGPGAELPE